jgi:hypothetical protein
LGRKTENILIFGGKNRKCPAFGEKTRKYPDFGEKTGNYPDFNKSIIACKKGISSKNPKFEILNQSI